MRKEMNNMSNGFIFISELSMFSVTQRSELLNALVGNDYVFLSDAYSSNAYLVIINEYSNFDTNKKNKIFKAINDVKFDNVDLSVKWYDVQNYDYTYNLNIDFTELDWNSDIHAAEKVIIAWIEYKDEQGDWDDICERCFKNNEYIHSVLNDKRTNMEYSMTNLPWEDFICNIDENEINNEINNESDNTVTFDEDNTQRTDNSADYNEYYGPVFNPLYGPRYEEETHQDYVFDTIKRNTIFDEKINEKPIVYKASVRKITIL